MNSFASRIVLTSVALVICTASTIGVIQYVGFSNDQLERHKEQLETKIERDAQYLQDITEDARSDVMFLTETPPIQGIIRARENDGVDPLDGSSEEVWKNRLGQIFEGLARNNSDYLQIRYIGLADNGREIVRVDRNGENIVRVLDNKLQSKGARNYVADTLRNDPGTLSLFEIDLNREFNVIERPLKPVMRVATPVHSQTGAAFGVIVININMKPVLARLTHTASEGSRLFLTNKNGDYLVHPDTEKTFGFEFGTPHMIQSDFPELARFVNDPTRRRFSENITYADGNHIAYFEKIVFEQGHNERYLIAGLLSPESVLWSGIRQTRNDVILITLVFTFFGAVFAFLFARVIVEPLAQLKHAAQKLESGGNVELIEPPRSTTDEIAHLSESFFSMAASLKDRQEKLEEKEAKIRAILESANSPIVTFDEDGVIQTVNPASSTFFGRSYTDLIGSKISDHVEGYTPINRNVTDDGGREFRAILGDGSKAPVYLSVNEMKFKERKQYAAILTDLTEQKKIDGLKRDLIEQRKMDNLKSEFISTVSHELRTPLTSIMGSLGLIQSGSFGAIPDKAASLLDMAQKNGKRLVNLINDILDIEKIESGNFKFLFGYFSVNDLLSDAKMAAEGYAAKHNVELIMELAPCDIMIKVDEGRFAQVMANLLSNAIKFSEAGSCVIMNATVSEESLRIAVSDKGPGIPLEFQKRIFEKFTQADSSSTRAQDGTGLGLNIAKAIIERFDGTIGFKSEPGAGTEFYFDLPTPAPVSLDRREGVKSHDDSARKILIVEDNADVRFVATRVLEAYGEIVTAETSLEAEAYLQHSKPDLVILDLQLPDNYGLDLANRYFSDPATSPKLIIYSVEEVPPYRLPPGAISLVKTRATNDDLRDAVDLALNSSTAKPELAEENGAAKKRRATDR
ncbi:ATP-binding protein [Hyphococcus sp.]|uniref:ATP-binding protein n=1 Tax=Hyphococcus sp. TaxID=2038636 RepID=UPI003CCBF7AD